jgi:predicted amidohydrolase YtcJ
MIHPYSDHPQSKGSLLVNGTTLTSLVKSWTSQGFQVNIHAIGDHANRLVVDAFSEALANLCPGQPAAECQTKHRLRIEHAQIVHPEDQARIFEMRIIPSVQPTHATSDMAFAEARLGAERLTQEAYRLSSYLPLGLILGSDFPVEPPNPFHGMYAAVSRKSPRTGKGPGGIDDGFLAEEALNMTAALSGFTTGPAWGAFLEGQAGVIQEGAFADWVVLDRPFEELKVDDLLTLKVIETWVGGKRVYQT